ncbi:uncharacterized protein LOC111636934 [Centruroides sculpturatus]|uniref:uncharacterized protein LOC111636934 n=1 Tax=Centruroides sculpturatus TaxID=218467 RepID=UPI000C6E2ED6|nr:uncharacterized protein LOC111636934 [Centruroides sculpturatus]
MDSLSSGNDILSPSVSRLSILSSDSPLKHELGEPPYSYVSKLSNATMPLPIITDGQLHLLWPLPQKIIQTKDDNFILSDDITVNVIHSPDNASIKEVLDLWKTFIVDVEEIGYKLNVESFLPTDCLAEKVICHINSSIFTRPESYRIVISSEQIRLLACDIQGLHNSICTFVQLLRLYKKENGIPTMCVSLFVFYK